MNHKMSCPSGIILLGERSIVGSTDSKGAATRRKREHYLSKCASDTARLDKGRKANVESDAWKYVLVYFVLQYFVSAARSGRAKVEAGRIVYDLPRSLKVLFLLGVPFTLTLAVWAFVTPLSWDLRLIAVVAPVFVSLTWPPVISLNRDFVGAHYWYGRNKGIPYSQVAKIVFHKQGTTTYVYGKNGVKIVHTAFHADTEGFRDELRRRTHFHIDER